MAPKTLVIGANGYLGRNFYAFYRRLFPDLIGTAQRDIEGLKKFNLLEPDLKSLDLEGYRYAIIAAGMINLSLCEKEKELTYLCNVTRTLELAKQLHERGIIPILFSSDYVFDGARDGYTEDDAVNPINEYGRQKAELERRIYEICGDRFLMLRISKIFGIERDDGTLLNEMADLIGNNKQVRAAHDQVFCPILVDDLIKAVVQLQGVGSYGLFNICGNKCVSRLEIARAIVQKLHADPSLVSSISLEDLHDPFLRPKNLSMVCHKLHRTIKLQMKSLDECIDQVVYCHRPQLLNLDSARQSTISPNSKVEADGGIYQKENHGAATH